MSNEHTTESDDRDDSDNTAIEGGFATGFIKIPIRREDIGPYVKYLVFAISGAIIILACFVGWAFVK